MTESISSKQILAPFFGSNATYVEAIYEAYLDDPNSIANNWKEYFDDVLGVKSNGEIPHAPIIEEFAYRLQNKKALAPATGGSDDLGIYKLIDAYRQHGHRAAKLDPLGLIKPENLSQLDPATYGLSNMDAKFGDEIFGETGLSLKIIIQRMHDLYADTVGAEFNHVSIDEEREWLYQRYESVNTVLSKQEKIHTLEQLTAAEGIESYLHTKYVGQKRFSLDGGDALIPLMDQLIQQSGLSKIEEVVIGMAHRGRLNILVNVLGKPPQDLFDEFEGKLDDTEIKGSGDVKYHMGFSTDIQTQGGPVHVALAFNPSHLEIVNPVVEGSVRSRQDRRHDAKGETVLPVLIHGDSAFSGQGVVMETLQMSQIRSFYTGGTVHIICNNQVGFTTNKREDVRSTRYCSDVAKMIEAPILHVNGDDAEAVIKTVRTALDYRNKFNKDVVIDLVCYRRHGHNEADEPAATQPQMYQVIRKHPKTREIYAAQLEQEGVVDNAAAKQLVSAYREGLDNGIVVSQKTLGFVGNEHTVDWSPYSNEHKWSYKVDTTLSEEKVAEYSKVLTTIPEGFKVHNRVKKIIQAREQMANDEIPMDWGFAENMAYAGILDDDYPIRLTGQDSGRGTFFHRHAVWHNQTEDAEHIPLQHIREGQPTFRVTDSFLSEEAVLGFEYGYSTAEPKTLVIWEAQFGDFVNGAQVVIDQFISSGESKWGRYSGLVMFLPHGYEGQGPEHSSARLERFLQLCAEHNMQVCAPTTPAQMFHMLRRQIMRPIRRPLIVMTPKSLLRHKLSVSTLWQLTDGGFQTIIKEMDDLDDNKVEQVVFCSGKVYYDLLEERRKRGIDNVALVRLEQLYPFPIKLYEQQVTRYKNAKQIVWCQEEPQNQGAWYSIRHRLMAPVAKHQELRFAGRKHASAPATGYGRIHKLEQEALINDALNINAVHSDSEHDDTHEVHHE
ncbi:MAG: 2-oxoglutarate dehydrogenase E1 component [Gammaproteobacteria bacterium]|nr:2-oxoglutarate dehydrogenase E1 component [Gammaproteobacteria bacterium]NNC97467.1 2-oxoglutarate dehydrogenase E1 component [Gammaproteobacteria bacterium]NNM14881.1 2-oxoglutarate dehydrogenase E1 component [Gammaproteobacteria bacterium]